MFSLSRRSKVHPLLPGALLLVPILSGVDAVAAHAQTTPPPATPKPAAPTAPASDDLKNEVGDYLLDQNGLKMTMTIDLKDGKLTATPTGQPTVTLEKVSGRKYKAGPPAPDGTTLTFRPVKDKPTETELVIDIAGQVLTLPRVKPAAATETPKTPAAPARLMALVGSYTSETPSAPAMEIKLQDGKLVLEAMGYPPLPVELDKDDVSLTSETLTGANVTIKIKREKDAKDGAVVGLTAKTPQGDAEYTFKPAPAVKPAIPGAELVGTYEPSESSLPTVEVKIENGKVVVVVPGSPTNEIKIEKDDTLTGPGVPEGYVVKLTRDKDKKITGFVLTTPNGPMLFTRRAAEEKKVRVAPETPAAPATTPKKP